MYIELNTFYSGHRIHSSVSYGRFIGIFPVLYLPLSIHLLYAFFTILLFAFKLPNDYLMLYCILSTVVVRWQGKSKKHKKYI